jgi:hypothetical protein
MPIAVEPVNLKAKLNIRILLLFYWCNSFPLLFDKHMSCVKKISGG